MKQQGPRILVRGADHNAPGGDRAPPPARHRQIWFWLIGSAVFLGFLALLHDILLPFILGMALAYLLDPLCDRLEKWGLSRLGATLLVCLFFLVLLVISLVMLVPLMLQQAAGLVGQLPAMLEALRDWAYRMLFFLERNLNSEVVVQAREAMSAATDNLVSLAGTFVADLITGGVALFNLLALLVITPVVTFFLLRDWDRMVEKVDGWLPRQHLLTLRGLASEVDETLAGFIRGQGLVCVFLGVFYGLGLTLASLNYGLVIGLIAGILSFIPYVGTTVGLLIAVGVAFAQFDSLWRVALVAAIFLGGQAIEGNYLTPKLVGDRVHLHPVWVLFGLLAGGALFGFVGVLLAVPISAVIGVGMRFLLSRYKQSVYYRGQEERPELPAGAGEREFELETEKKRS